VAIKTLLSSSGIASLEDIASGVSSRDPSQVEYYVEKVKRYPKDGPFQVPSLLDTSLVEDVLPADRYW